MPDLIIGGNTYKNIDRVKIKKADGTMATFYENAYDGGILFSPIKPAIALAVNIPLVVDTINAVTTLTNISNLSVKKGE